MFYTVNQVADMLHVCRETVVRYLRLGLLRGGKIGGRKWVVPAEAVQELAQRLGNETSGSRAA